MHFFYFKVRGKMALEGKSSTYPRSIQVVELRHAVSIGMLPTIALLYVDVPTK